MDQFLKILKALSDETRFKIIDLLLNYDFCVGALARRLDISEAAVSQHLQILRKAGLVKGEKRGYYTHYGVDRDIFREVAEKMYEIASQNPKDKDGCHEHRTDEHRYCKEKKRKQ